MGYTDATWIKINKAIDTLGQLSTEGNGYPEGAVAQLDLVKKIVEQTGRRKSLAYRMIDICVELKLMARGKGTNPLDDRRLKYVHLTADGVTALQTKLEG